MENYPSYSYPDSGNSSPRSREVDFENPPPSWEELSATLPPNYKVKFMVSYNGKIQPRSHDNLLSYVGGETKILAVDRSVKFSSIHSKLASLVSPDATDATPFSDFTFKYQLPGEDLDALISVTNDDDLEHMMHEFDRMLRGSSKPARLRLFIFPDQHPRNSGGSAFSSANSDRVKLSGPDRENKFVDTILSSQIQHQINHPNQNAVVSDLPPQQAASPPPPPLPVHNNVDFLFGLEKTPVHVPGPVQVPVPEPEMIRELNRLQISAQELHHLQLQQQQQQQSTMFPAKNDENFAEPYRKTSSPKNIQPSMQTPQGYWQTPQHQNNQPQQLQHRQQYHPQQQPPQQPVYMMHAPPQESMYHAPMMRPVVGGQIQQNQGYYQVQQRMPSEQVYREQPVYNMPAPATIPPMSSAAQVRPGMAVESTGYAQVTYDSATGRQVYYAAAPFPGMMAAAASGGGDMRSSGDGKIVQKVGASPAVV